MANYEQYMDYFKLIHEDMNKLEFRLDSKNRIYYPLFSASIEHCISINFLKNQFMTVSMYALVRPALESYLRAMWVKYHLGELSMDDDLSKMHFPKRIEVLISEVDAAVPEFKEINFLQATFDALTPNMHDFTHGGIQSVARQYSGDTLTNIRDDEELESILKFSVLVSSLAYSEIIQENVGGESMQANKISKAAERLLAL
ncbi:hypothetical protein F3S07_10555 [Vibrio alginolyticus]|uniref:DUF6988 family protein n=1 Tax=Vibrio TaxID=662 RepID=UPI000320BA46|nr:MULTISPECIES: hypothetical protein [Vibrio]EGQ9573622.1 hypothetical protein [Vibrio alginolyticus]EIF2705634.1 hypothetical protein [Vibrio alginolyticus]ELA7387531.1 hypothetical protein [Vibrio alginolyticus]ELB2770416.1 hypothetical protein [Vibrio alginolyticus]MBT0069000.1 hypothetical protein [Vibrio alginolyticus]